mmetsp:Transcript_22763/g.33616  ORF Transcript_22763/g.33616 Transcript_22763/m.33616 type:complete len:80 (-) Transcript_22763:546-785(-)
MGTTKFLKTADAILQDPKALPQVQAENTQLLDPNHVVSAVARIQEQTAGRRREQISKGIYPMMDSMLEESLEILQNELE